MLKRLVGSAVCAMAGLGLVVLVNPAAADKIIGSFNNDSGECVCECTPGPCPVSRDDAHAIAVCRAACTPCAEGCPRPLVEACRVGRDPRWPHAILKCRSVFPLPR